MGWLKKLLGKEQTHEEWLAAHPDKASMKTSGDPIVSEEEAQRVRSTMEDEMATAQRKRESN